MPYAEAPEVTVQRFSRSWDTELATNRLLDNFVSISNETNRAPDGYHFLVSDGRLIDPASGKPVLDFVLPGVERDIALELEGWAAHHDEGLAFWVSPSLPGVYPCSKVIIHQIAYTPQGAKAILNTAILFDADFNNPEALRAALFTQPDTPENIRGILEWIQNRSDKKVSLTPPSSDIRLQAQEFAEMVQQGVSAQAVIHKMRQAGFLGNNSISCPGGGSSFLRLTESSAALLIHTRGRERYVKNCGVCGAKIEAYICPGYKCKHCKEVYLGVC